MRQHRHVVPQPTNRLTTDGEPWWTRAACQGEHVLFHDPDYSGQPMGGMDLRHNSQEREAEAKAICADCPVRVQCRADIDAWETGRGDHHAHGIFAGETAAERVARRRRGGAA